MKTKELTIIYLNLCGIFDLKIYRSKTPHYYSFKIYRFTSRKIPS